MMPNRSYVPRNSPPNRRDHFNAHPAQVIFSVVSVLVGGLLIAAALVQGFVPSRSVENLPLLVSAGVALLLGVGGVLTFWATLTCHDEMRTVWLALRSGLFALAFGWGSYALSVAAVYPNSIIPWLSSAGISATFGVTFWVTRWRENNLRALVSPEGT